jgi:hypothetical protein
VTLIRATDPPRPFAQLGWPGRRFRVLRELGEPRDFSLLGYDDAGHLVDEERNLRHEDHDGVGAFSAMLHSRGMAVTMPVVAAPPSGWRAWRLLWRYLQHNRTVAADRKRIVTTGSDPAAAVLLLTETQTSALLVTCRAERSSVTAWLLSNLDELAADAALQPGSPRSWMVPVNLRTASRLSDDNAVGAMMLPFYGTRTATELRDTMHHQVEQQLPFGPQVLVPWMLRQSEAKLRARAQRGPPRKPIFGLLTNLGAWPALPPGWWAVVPPTSRASWLACGVLSVGGRMALCLKADFRLGLDAQELLAMLRAMRMRIVGDADPEGGHLFSETSTAEAA